jgi:RNA-directed DNA polymerase
MHRATGEALLVPSRNRRSKVHRTIGRHREVVEGERVEDGPEVARKRGNARGAKGPCCRQGFRREGRQGRVRRTPIGLQDLSRRLYAKAKAEPSWRFWGLYVHVCKMETLREAYALAKKNDGAPGIDGVSFEAIEEAGVDGLLEQIRDELVSRRYRPLRKRRKEIPKDGGTKVRVLGIPAIRDRVVQGALRLILEPIFEEEFWLSWVRPTARSQPEG